MRPPDLHERSPHQTPHVWSREVLFDTINAKGVLADTIFQAVINVEKDVWNVSKPDLPSTLEAVATGMAGVDCHASRFPGLCCTSWHTKRLCLAANGCYWSGGRESCDIEQQGVVNGTDLAAASTVELA